MQIGSDLTATSVRDDATSRAAGADVVGRAERALFWALIGTLAAMPLPFGSARPWAWSLAAVLIGLTLLGYGLCLAFVPGFRIAVPLARMRLPMTLLGLAAAWAVVQMMPLGSSELGHPLWGTSNEVLGRSLSGRISVDPYATATALMRLGTYVAVFFLSVQLCRHPDRAYTALKVLVAIGTAYAVYGLLAFFFTPDYLLWLPRQAYRGDLSSTFVNRNSYATFAGLGLCAGVALLAKLIHRPALASPSRRVIIANLLRIATERAWAPLAAVVALFSAVLLTHSRAGFLSTGIGVLVLLFCLMTASRLNLWGRVITVALVIAGMIMIVHLSGETTLERLQKTSVNSDGRVAVFNLVQEGIANAPVLGHGYGAFESAFQGYVDGTLDGYYPNAHNDYLEIAFELGMPAAALLIGSILSVAIWCLIGVYRRRRDIVYPALGAASAALVGAHAMVDFSLQIPAIAAIFAFTLGLGFTQSWTSAES